MLQVRGHKKIKRFSGAIAICLLCVLAFWPSDNGYRVVKRGSESEALNLIVNPRIQSVDRKGLPYEVQAESAQRQEIDGKTVLTTPVGLMTLSSGERLEVKSDAAMLSKNADKMKLKGGVKVSSEGGYVISTQKADVNILDKSAETDHAVKGQGPQGALCAEGFKIDQDGNMSLKGKTEMTFHVKGN